MERNYYQLARDLAEKATARREVSSRGIWHLQKEDLLCLFDNTPYEIDPEARPRQTNRIINRMQNVGIMVVAQAHSADEFTLAILFDCSINHLATLRQIVSEEVDETLRELYAG